VKEFAFYLRRFALNAENKTMPSEKFQTAFVCHAYAYLNAEIGKIKAKLTQKT
jgi:hypothetical protein